MKPIHLRTVLLVYSNQNMDTIQLL